LAAAYAQPANPRAIPAVNPAAPQWQTREPTDRSDPVPHQCCLAVPRNELWSLLAASVRGRLHAHQALWRDDSFAWTATGNASERGGLRPPVQADTGGLRPPRSPRGASDWTCLAVADGAGSASLSRIGSHLACVAGVKALAEALGGVRFHPTGDGTPPREELHRVRDALVSAARASRQAVVKEAERRDRPLQLFHTTLLLVAHVPLADRDFVAALQIGDGAVALYRGPGACQVLGQADRGGYASETLFLTTPGIEEDLERRTTFACPAGLLALAVMTDGVADDFFPEDQRLVELFEGDPIADLQDSQGLPLRGVLPGVLPDVRDGQALVEWLDYWKRGSSDDRTLVLLHRQSPPIDGEDAP
jgi:hypothetical protein